VSSFFLIDLIKFTRYSLFIVLSPISFGRLEIRQFLLLTAVKEAHPNLALRCYKHRKNLVLPNSILSKVFLFLTSSKKRF
jgi:hypothetical protein